MPPKGYVFKSLEERFNNKVEILESGCWRWKGALADPGYGKIGLGGRETGEILAHRYSYIKAKGFIWPGNEIDHLCRNRWCVNPDHLEQVTHQENVRRGSAPSILITKSRTCGKGHPRTPENIYWRKDRPGKWNCTECRRERRDRLRHRKTV